MLAYAREKMFGLVMSMDTNATQPFKDEYLLLDWINCSIDGSDAESYKTYRRGGDWNKAITFMTNAAKRKRDLGSECKIRWKYILFNSTDEPEQLATAQRIAAEIGIDELDFVITACGAGDKSVMPSTRWTALTALQDHLKTSDLFANTIVSRS